MAGRRIPMPAAAAAAALSCWLLVAAALCGSALAGPLKASKLVYSILPACRTPRMAGFHLPALHRNCLLAQHSG